MRVNTLLVGFPANIIMDNYYILTCSSEKGLTLVLSPFLFFLNEKNQLLTDKLLSAVRPNGDCVLIA